MHTYFTLMPLQHATTILLRKNFHCLETHGHPASQTPQPRSLLNNEPHMFSSYYSRSNLISHSDVGIRDSDSFSI